ncbi:iron-sulfur cluster biosynthesis family protein [Salisediminibacterium beveridgei]|uniref:Core domain-containing protein n=1 Tax=Salisediminibacterium beveridgei TaxID=632773 RepID=A0A1D7QVJ4_9BACI|nr:iron-sulfur cluster biosynthesis family protein [Salisediminibacterium beveridgei]AOM83030.1 hypothetical protein BBEV_1669 [Salisediminibacterium beveridgei]
MMNFIVSDDAIAFYKHEMRLVDGDELHLFVRVGGVGSGGFSVGLARGKPELEAEVIEKDGILFYVTAEDAWYFDGMTIDYNADFDAVTYDNPTIINTTNPNQSKDY